MELPTLILQIVQLPSLVMSLAVGRLVERHPREIQEEFMTEAVRRIDCSVCVPELITSRQRFTEKPNWEKYVLRDLLVYNPKVQYGFPVTNMPCPFCHQRVLSSRSLLDQGLYSPSSVTILMCFLHLQEQRVQESFRPNFSESASNRSGYQRSCFFLLRTVGPKNC